MADDDPNEAYDVVPIADGNPNTAGWWTARKNGVPVFHSPDRSVLDDYVSNPDYRASLSVQLANKEN